MFEQDEEFREEIEKNEKLKEAKEGFKHSSDFQEINEIVDRKGFDGFADMMAKKMDRRQFIKTMGFATAGFSLLGLPAFAQKQKEEAKVTQRYKAAYSAIIMAVFWVTKGAQTFQHLGGLTGGLKIPGLT